MNQSDSDEGGHELVDGNGLEGRGATGGVEAGDRVNAGGEEGGGEMVQWGGGREEGLSAKQQAALVLLTDGRSVVESAKGAGVSRYTLHRWMREHAGFAAAYNAWQEEAITRARGQVLALTESAVGAVRGALEKGDVKTALTVLKSMGVMREPKPGPTSVEEVERKRKREKRAAAVEEKKAEWDLGLDELGSGLG